MLVDGENFPRVLYPIRRLTLTKFKLPILRGARTSTVVAAAKKFGLQQKWEASTQAQKIATHAKRANLSDFERFSVMVNRKRRSFAVRAIAKKSLATASKAPAKAAAKKKWANLVDWTMLTAIAWKHSLEKAVWVPFATADAWVC